MFRPIPLSLVTLTLLSACGPQTPPPAVIPVPQAGLERVIGKPAPTLIALFGDPDLDVREGPARKLQFVGPICVLDAYLYPGADGTPPIARYIDARRPNGDDFDRASCIAALARRPQAR